MIIKRNSAEFKSVRDFVNDAAESRNRRKLVKIYSLKPSEDLSKKKIIPASGASNEVIYELAFDNLLFNLLDAKHKLCKDGDIYYFKSSEKSGFIELPFKISNM
jgi:hypothetical protein